MTPATLEMSYVSVAFLLAAGVPPVVSLDGTAVMTTKKTIRKHMSHWRGHAYKDPFAGLCQSGQYFT